MTKQYIEETKAHLNEPIIKKHLKQIKLNRILWTVGSSLVLVLTIILAIIGKVVTHWDSKTYAIAVAVPAIITALAIVMTVFIYIGNEVGVKMYKQDKITFYSGPWSNSLYINDELIYKGSSEHKMVGELSDKSLCKVMMKTTSFTINILPPGSDPVTGAKKAEQKPEEKPAEQPKPQA